MAVEKKVSVAFVWHDYDYVYEGFGKMPEVTNGFSVLQKYQTI